MSENETETERRIRAENELAFDQINAIERFMRLDKVRALNKALRIEKYSYISKFFAYVSFFGALLIIGSLFFIPYLFLWIYALIIILLLGFVFAKPNQKYNFTIPVGILMVLAFVPGNYMQMMLYVDAGPVGGADPDSLGTPWVEIDGDNERTDDINLEISHICHNAEEIQIRESVHSSFILSHTREWESYKKSQKITLQVLEEGELPDGAIIYIRVKFRGLGEEKMGEDSITFQSTGGVLDPPDDDDDGDEDKDKDDGASDLFRRMKDFSNINPMKNPDDFATNLMHLMNWIIFFGILALAGTTIGDAVSGNWGEIAQKAITIGATVLIITVVYGIFALVPEIEIITIWDTIGGAWDDLMGKVGLAQLKLDISDSEYYTPDVINTGYRASPLILTVVMGVLAYYYRDKDLKSILFVQDVTDDNEIEVSPTTFSIPILGFLTIMILYVVGYFLTTATEDVSMNPFVSIVFYISAVIVLMLIGFKILILRTQKNWKEYLKSTIKWSFFGLFGLYAWFSFFQPVMYDMGLIDIESSLLTLSQGLNIFNHDIATQFFLVATPETLVFQILMVGLGCRIYYYARRTKIQKEQKNEIRKEMWAIAYQYRNIPINNSISKANLRRIAKAQALEQKFDKLEAKLEEDKIQRVSLSYFIIPALFSALIGSFFFSWYHAFRRGISFINWWMNPYYGLTYFGASILLSLVAFFCFPASIIVHALNNIIALLVGG